MSYEDPFRPFNRDRLGDILGDLDRSSNYRLGDRATKDDGKYPVIKEIMQRKAARHEAELNGELVYRPSRRRVKNPI